jgi:hypothetical protein
MRITSTPPATLPPPVLPRLATITTAVRQCDERLWALLRQPGPLSADDWAYIEAQERAEQARESGR